MLGDCAVWGMCGGRLCCMWDLLYVRIAACGLYFVRAVVLCVRELYYVWLYYIGKVVLCGDCICMEVT